MLHNFKVKPMFENQYHQRHQFTLKFNRDTYQGIFKNGEIQWFHPIPQCKLEKKVVQKIESKVNDLMINYVEQS
jgi:Family of unknown function (DUF5342)